MVILIGMFAFFQWNESARKPDSELLSSAANIQRYAAVWHLTGDSHVH